MRRIEQVGLPQQLLVVDAHPDDALMHGHLIDTLRGRKPKVAIDDYVATLGRASTVNFYAASSPDFVISGKRRGEALAIAASLGLQKVIQDDLPDGRVADHHDTVVERLIETARAQDTGKKIGFVSIRGVADKHPDHIAVGEASDEAAARLATDHGFSVTTLQLQNPLDLSPAADLVQVGTTPVSIRRTLTAAQFNYSQHSIKSAATVPEGRASDLVPTPDGQFLAHPDTIADLSQYPVWTPAVYARQRFSASS